MEKFSDFLGKALIQLSNLNSKRFLLAILVNIGLYHLIVGGYLDPEVGLASAMGIDAYLIKKYTDQETTQTG